MHFRFMLGQTGLSGQVITVPLATPQTCDEKERKTERVRVRERGTEDNRGQLKKVETWEGERIGVVQL